MSKSEILLFIALLPPQDIQERANQIKQHFADNYQSRRAFKSPPHITLQPPFEWEKADLPILVQHLEKFSSNQINIPVTIEGFGAFPPRVIYLKPLKTPELMSIQKALATYLENSLNIIHKPSKNRPFSPHVTVALRDLTKKNFHLAWEEFEHRQFSAKFTIPRLTLLIHKDKKWEIAQEFNFLQNQTMD